MSDNTSNNKRIAKNTIYLTIRMLFVLGVSLYTSRVFLSALGVEDFGIYNVVCGFVAMFAFLNNAMSTGVQRFYNFELGKNGTEGANKVYITSVFSQLTLAVIIVILTETLGMWYMYNKMVIPVERFTAALWIFQFAIISLVINIMSVPYSGIIMAREKMDYYAVVSIIDVVLKLGIALLIPYVTTDKLITYGALILVISLINFMMYAMYSKLKFAEIKFKLRFYKALFKSLLTFSGWNIFGKVAIMLKEQGLNMVLNLFFGPVVNAARGVAFQVNSALQGFISNITIAVKPQLTQAYAQGDKTRTFNLMFSISKLCYIILLLMAVPICVEIDYILYLWLGENVPEYTNIFVILVIATTFVNNLNAPISFVVQATGEMRRYQIWGSFFELLILPISFVILKVGAEPWTVFVVVFVCVIISQSMSLFILKSIEDYSLKKYCLKVILPLLSITVISVFLSLLIQSTMHTSLFRLFIIFAFSSLVITLCTFWGGLDKVEKGMVTQVLKQKIRLNKKK